MNGGVLIALSWRDLALLVDNLRFLSAKSEFVECEHHFHSFFLTSALSQQFQFYNTAAENPLESRDISSNLNFYGYL